jgi:hypothetical protein
MLAALCIHPAVEIPDSYTLNAFDVDTYMFDDDTYMFVYGRRRVK